MAPQDQRKSLKIIFQCNFQNTFRKRPVFPRSGPFITVKMTRDRGASFFFSATDSVYCLKEASKFELKKACAREKTILEFFVFFDNSTKNA